MKEYLMMRVKTQNFLTHLFEDDADGMFRSKNIHDCYKYTDRVKAEDAARGLSKGIGEPVEVVPIS